MPNNQFISFVIPAFNCSTTIKESVDSIFDGNFKDEDEIIIVDDASTDNTKDILTKLQKKYPIIKIIRNKKNKGCPASRNIGISQAKNPIIFNLDSDNILALSSIEKLKNHLLTNNADIAGFSEMHYFTKNIKNITHKWTYNHDRLTLADFLAGPITPGPGGNFMYMKKGWKKVGGYWEYGKGLHEAWGFTLKQLANSAKFVVLPDSFYYHRHGHDSLFIRETKKEKNIDSLMATKIIMNYIGLLNNKDASYIKSDYGSKNWFNEFSAKNPLHLKTGEKGRTGKVVMIKKNINIFKKILRKTKNKLNV